MTRPPPGSTRTDTPFPYTTLFRSCRAPSDRRGRPPRQGQAGRSFRRSLRFVRRRHRLRPIQKIGHRLCDAKRSALCHFLGKARVLHVAEGPTRVLFKKRPEERRGGKECGRTVRPRWAPSHQKKNTL